MRALYETNRENTVIDRRDGAERRIVTGFKGEGAKEAAQRARVEYVKAWERGSGYFADGKLAAILRSRDMPVSVVKVIHEGEEAWAVALWLAFEKRTTEGTP